jgi:hypothetical protein
MCECPKPAQKPHVRFWRTLTYHPGSAGAPGCDRLLTARQRACSARCRAALSRSRSQRAVDARHERLAELLRLALRIVKEQ